MYTLLMFTLDQIKDIHSRVKSWADFPRYIQDLKAIGLLSYEIVVSDGYAHYYGQDGYDVQSGPKYEAIIISSSVDKPQFIQNLKAHQQGQTDYMTFVHDCAKSGIVKWIVDTEAMTCTYYDRQDEDVLQEMIPSL